MEAMVLHTVVKPLELREVGEPEPDDHQLKLDVHTCGICHTDLHIVDGELEKPSLPLITRASDRRHCCQSRKLCLGF